MFWYYFIYINFLKYRTIFEIEFLIPFDHSYILSIFFNFEFVIFYKFSTSFSISLANLFICRSFYLYYVKFFFSVYFMQLECYFRMIVFFWISYRIYYQFSLFIFFKIFTFSSFYTSYFTFSFCLSYTIPHVHTLFSKRLIRSQLPNWIAIIYSNYFVIYSFYTL